MPVGVTLTTGMVMVVDVTDGGVVSMVAVTVMPREVWAAPALRAHTRNEWGVSLVSPVMVADMVALVVVVPAQHVAGAVAPACHAIK